MKKSLIPIVISAILLSLVGGVYYCVNNQHSQKERSEANEININLDSTQNFLSNIIIEEIGEDTSKIYLYKPVRLNVKIYHVRPDTLDKDVFLCFPAAFTDRTNKIDGLFIKNGVILNNLTLNHNGHQLNGVCIISNNSIDIKETKDVDYAQIRQIVKQEKSAFQQFLLVMNSEIIPITAWQNPNRKQNFKRRAIVQFDNYFCIAESLHALSIRNFQEILIAIGVKKAINLDMGTWSEGWHRNHHGEIVVTGENMQNTNRQTNWIVYEK